MIEVKQNNDEKHGSFEAFIDGRRAGMMTYTGPEKKDLL